MSKFDVPEMSCGHCVAAIEKSIKAIDPSSSVNCDVTARTVDVASANTDTALIAAIKDAGYDATPAGAA